ncbi:hypothetical protein IV102_19665 [bacterium]|nr:hypothetical protein [bacterium]
MADDAEFYTPPARRRGRNPLGGLLLGAMVGAAATFAFPSQYVAEVSLIFPSINSNVLKQVTKALKLDAAGVEWSKSVATSDAQMVEAASLVFKSRAAITSSLRGAKVVLPPTLVALQGDPIESFRNNNVQVETLDGTSIKLEVLYSRVETARALCQGLLDYYTTFVHEHRLTNTARTRQQLEEKLVRVDKRLGTLEKKLLEASGGRFRVLGDSTIRPDPKIMKELWKQRILESGSSGRVLDEMRKIRKEAAQDNKDNPDPEELGDDWRSRWGSTTLEDTTDREGSLPRNARRSDMPSRLELERVYEETLLLYHAGLLQYDFLSMWESLENFDFEIVDPVTVHQQAATTRMVYLSLLGALLGTLASLLWRRP